MVDCLRIEYYMGKPSGIQKVDHQHDVAAPEQGPRHHERIDIADRKLLLAVPFYEQEDNELQSVGDEWHVERLYPQGHHDHQSQNA